MFSISIVAVLMAFALPGIRIKKESYVIDKKETVALKGILCLMIFIHHFSGWFADPDPIIYLFSHCGSFMVSVFFFLSAYGISKSSEKKRQNFKDLILRILKIFIPFWISDIIYIIFYYLGFPVNIKVNATSILLSVLNLSEIVLFSWFVSTIVFLYIIYFVVEKTRKINKTMLFFGILILLSFFVPELWVTYIVFPVGLVIEKYEKKMISLSRFKYVIMFAVMLLVTGFAIFLKYFGETSEDLDWVGRLSDMISGTAFSIIVYLLITRIHIGNRILLFIGEISYEFYLIHGLGIFFASKFFTIEQPYVFIGVAFAFTFIVSFIVNRISKKIICLLPRKTL